MDPSAVPDATDRDQRPGEVATGLPDRYAAGLFFIGRIETPWPRRADCPRHGDLDGPECRLHVDARWGAALEGLDEHAFVQVLYWMHLGRRDLVVQHPRASARPRGTFAIRSPLRPNPIASSICRLVGRDGPVLRVRGMDCVDGTPLLDIKPDRCPVIRTTPP